MKGRLSKRITALGQRLVAVLTVSGVPLVAFAQTTPQPNPPLVIRSLTGRDLFQFYCATCHGKDGKGHGPVAAALKIPPPDLTLLQRSNRGVFPHERVEAFVTNGGAQLTASHGSADMPVWGPVFRGLDSSDTLATMRIANVVEFLQSLQVK